MKRGFTNKRCPKCNGNLFIEEGVHPDLGGYYHNAYEWCLQCGYQRNVETATALTEEAKAVLATNEPASLQ